MSRQLTTEEIYGLRPADGHGQRGRGKRPQVQMSYPGDDGRRQQMPFVIPQAELSALDRYAGRGNRSAVIREAVLDLALRVGVVSKSPARVQVEHTALVLERDPDELAAELGVRGPSFRRALDALTRACGDSSAAVAIRWAVRVHLAERS